MINRIKAKPKTSGPTKRVFRSNPVNLANPVYYRFFTGPCATPPSKRVPRWNPKTRSSVIASVTRDSLRSALHQILNGVPSFFGTAAFLSVTYAGSPLR
jgi:hypothetical protein